MGCLQWDILIGAVEITKIFVWDFIACFAMAYTIEQRFFEIVLQTSANRRQAMKPVGLNRWRIFDVSSVRPVDNRRQLWSFSGNVVPHRATYSSICWMIVLLRNQVWRRSIGQHFRRQHRIADSPPVARLRSYPLPLSRRCCQSRVKFLLRSPIRLKRSRILY